MVPMKPMIPITRWITMKETYEQYSTRCSVCTPHLPVYWWVPVIEALRYQKINLRSGKERSLWQRYNEQSPPILVVSLGLAASDWWRWLHDSLNNTNPRLSSNDLIHFTGKGYQVSANQFLQALDDAALNFQETTPKTRFRLWKK